MVSRPGAIQGFVVCMAWTDTPSPHPWWTSSPPLQRLGDHLGRSRPCQLDVGIVGPADPVAQRQDPGDVAAGIVTRAGNEPGIAFGQIRGA